MCENKPPNFSLNYKKILFLACFPNFRRKKFFHKIRLYHTQLDLLGLPATVRGPTSTTAAGWHLNFKDIECNAILTKNYYTAVSMQKISSIHKLIQQILGSHELNGQTQF